MDTYTAEKYQQHLQEICPSSQKYSKQHVTFRKQIASFFKWNHSPEKGSSLLPKSSIFLSIFAWMEKFLVNAGRTLMYNHRQNSIRYIGLQSIVACLFKSSGSQNAHVSHTECVSNTSLGQMKHHLDATLCRFYFCRVTLHVSGASAHHQEYLRLRPKHVEWLCRNKTCTVCR